LLGAGYNGRVGLIEKERLRHVCRAFQEVRRTCAKILRQNVPSVCSGWENEVLSSNPSATKKKTIKT
jgi:hypothetical protein